MARIRNLAPGFFTNEKLVELPFEYRLLFAGLWTLADREGRLEDRPKKIRMEVFPSPDDRVDCNAGVQALHDVGLVLRYVVDGVPYIQILQFLKYQRPHPREAASVIPPPEVASKDIPRTYLGESEDGQGDVEPGYLSGSSGSSGSSERERDTRATPIDLAVAMRKAGVEANGAHPAVIALAEQGVTVETVLAACEHARQAKGGAKVPVGYVAKVLSSWSQQAADTRANGAQAPPSRASPPARPPTKAESFVAKLNGSHPEEPLDVIATVAGTPSTRRLGA